MTRTPLGKGATASDPSPVRGRSFSGSVAACGGLGTVRYACCCIIECPRYIYPKLYLVHAQLLQPETHFSAVLRLPEPEYASNKGYRYSR